MLPKQSCFVVTKIRKNGKCASFIVGIVGDNPIIRSVGINANATDDWVVLMPTLRIIVYANIGLKRLFLIKNVVNNKTVIT